MNRSLPEALARSLRHEIGDLLQKVYASVAILKNRLPPGSDMEQGVLDRLMARAEGCRRILDTAHDFACSLSLDCQPVDLAQVAATAMDAARERYPQVEWTTESTGPTVVMADVPRARLMTDLVLVNAVESGATRVQLRTAAQPDSKEVKWTITDNGPGVPPDLSAHLFRPFFTTRPGHCGLGLALVRKLVELHGGRAQANNLAGGGFQVDLTFPAGPPAG
jgi:signal transduction histidine kinase